MGVEIRGSAAELLDVQRAGQGMPDALPLGLLLVEGADAAV
jgi:hypothetical protein